MLDWLRCWNRNLGSGELKRKASSVSASEALRGESPAQCLGEIRRAMQPETVTVGFRG